MESSKNAENLMQQAAAHLQNKSFSIAADLYQRVLLISPTTHKAALGVALAMLAQNDIATAIDYMQKAVAIAPEIPLYRRNLGELLRRMGRLDAALAAHQEAVAIAPNCAESHFLLGLAYHDNQQFDLAINHYHTAIGYDLNYGVAWNNLGTSLESRGDKHTAKIAYATAIGLNSKHAEAHNNLAAIYSEEGKLEEARAHFSAAIAANPDFIEAHYNLSQIKTYTLHDPHLGFLESLQPKLQGYPPSIQIRYQFALGKALDDTKQYERAFEAYTKGNRLHYQHLPWDKTKLEGMVDQLPKLFTKSILKPPQKTSDTRCPIFIVGMPRAGTTLIEQILASHGSIYGAGELRLMDEIIQNACATAGLSFSNWVAQLTADEFAVLGQKYLDQAWQLAPDKNFIIDKMPANCFYIGMIYKMFPRVKIIHAIRDPMDSCFSCYTHLFKDTMRFAYDLSTLGTYYILYAKAMQHWQAILPPHTIFNLPYEKMITNHEALARQLVEYIGLAWDPNCLKFYANNRTVKTASLAQVRKPIYKTSLQRWRHFANELTPLLQIVAPYRNLQGISA